ncbi:Lipid-A-disaccharide synthase protein [Marine Group I thaumarchaeote SCGC AAA799-E16]|uniref:Lipid-A-disaccharide synthase protein n=2 Tax=Marine Group I TaxID=905826 RepID=A0A087S423_9ARCH|nr:Lipid-A-disaccharide synthase protein [Marine Group I thaumarchaeote SCGC AAA799-E16]KFM20477.1 Lipid-A-disaccharide synthase protein [Marine Group I thaumarchaeote SCGC RSA3]
MKIWIDILTPKQLLFSEAIIKKLGKNHQILCTSREYGEVIKLAKIRGFGLISVGKHGGEDKETKLKASIQRMEKLFTRIKNYSPDIVISFCSPEAARISFGLGTKHIAFCDSPHADAVMRLTLPLIQKLLIPKAIPKREFSKYGIPENNIIQYNAIDAFVTLKRKIDKKSLLPFTKNDKKNILIRLEEEQAAYSTKSKKIIPIIKKIIFDHNEENIIILGRYSKQIKNIQREVGSKIKIVKMTFDGKHLLQNTDVFIGSGGTMTAESALLGIPTISYNAVPNIIEEFLVKKGLVKRETDPKKISNQITKISKSMNQKRAKKITNQMEDPIEKLIKVIRD